MLQLAYPGVYTREVASGVRSIAGAPTSVALFVGPTKSGIDERPIRILNYGDFQRAFGGLSQNSALSYSVLHFFANGGGRAYVIRVPANNAVKAASGVLRDGHNAASLTVAALSSGASGGLIFVEFDGFGIGANPFSASAPAANKKLFNLTVTDALTGRVERFANLTTMSNNARFADKVVNDPDTGSKLVSIKINQIGENGPQMTGTVYEIGGPLAAGGFPAAVKALVSVTRRAADGSDDAPNSIVNLEVDVFASGEAKPVTALDLVNRIVKALNARLRETSAAKLGGAEIEGALFEGGKFMRLKLTAPTGAPGDERIHDATVTMSNPSSGANNTKLLAVFDLTQKSSNPSRYRLGFAYNSSQIVSPLKGVDGDPSGQPSSAKFKSVISGLETPDPFFNLLCLPDVVCPAASDPNALHHSNAMEIYGEAARICGLKFAFLLIDPLPKVKDVGSAEAWKTGDFTFQSPHSGAWFPNIRVDDPLEPGAIRSHPPSGAIAGVIARTDAQVGVWAAPAGTDAVVAGAYGPAVELPDVEHGFLNPIGVNVIRKFPIFGTVAFGSRTVDGADAMASEWKYVPVRRTASYILRSLSEGLRWAVHKPNGEELWSQLRIASTAFMHGLFRQGAFKGVSAREAYFVACDASTTSADDIDAGVVNIVVGFAPLKPAEFVVIVLRQIVQASN